MSDVEKIVQVAESAAKTQDPVISSVLFVVIIVIALLIFAKPLMNIVKDAKGLNAAEAKLQAEESLFDQLRKQVIANQEAIEKLNSEKDRWFEKAHQLEKEVDRLKHFEQMVQVLEKEVDRLKHFEQMVQVMKRKLDEKDEIIATQNAENKRLMHEILQLKDRIHELELRITRDESLIKGK